MPGVGSELVASNADAVLVGASGTPAATPHKELKARGYDERLMLGSLAVPATCSSPCGVRASAVALVAGRGTPCGQIGRSVDRCTSRTVPIRPA